jgi:ectoine hydroxylase-related dioxygenase (phytanoyl-CoA dioxygenase family)
MLLSSIVSETDRKKFRETGYWITPKLIDDDRISRLREAHDRVWRGERDGSGYPMGGMVRLPQDPLGLRKLDNGWWINDEIKSLVTDPVLGAIAADLLVTDEIRLWHDQVLYKPGTNSKEGSVLGNVGWHQDYGYWQCSSTTDMITAWVALQDTDLNNGGMMTIVGSNHWGFVPDSDAFFDPDLEGLKQRFAASGHPWMEEPCILKAGQASFHHALTFHGSGPNYSNSARMSVVAHFMPKDTAYRPFVQWHPNVQHLGPRPRDGQLFDDERFFPLVFSRHAKAD